MKQTTAAMEHCADAIALYEGKLVLVERLSDPKGLAIPGGRRDRLNGQLESVDVCAVREFKEETGLSLVVEGVLGTYDDPQRDPRGPKASTVVYGKADGWLKDEPGKTRVLLLDPDAIDGLRGRFAFDHYEILKDWQQSRADKKRQQTKADLIVSGMDAFAQRIERKKKLYLELLSRAEQDASDDPVYRIEEPALLRRTLECFGAALDGMNAKAELTAIYEAGVHKKTGALLICNKGATLYSLSPRTQTPAITRHIGFCIYMPGLGIEFVNVGLVGDVYNGKAVLRTESACTPSFIYGSQRCNCAHQWESIREVAAQLNRVTPPRCKDGESFERWVQKQFVYTNGKHIAKNGGQGFVLMHVDTQNGMGSGFTENEFAFDLFTRASIRHRGEYTSEQVTGATMLGGFEAIGIRPDPRRESDNAGYKITYVVLDYLGVSKNVVILSNNPWKMCHLHSNGYLLDRVKSVGAINLAGAQEAEQRGSEFGHLDIDGSCVSFDDEVERLKREITEKVTQ